MVTAVCYHDYADRWLRVRSCTLRKMRVGGPSLNPESLSAISEAFDRSPAWSRCLNVKPHFGAREATIFSKRGSPRSGSQNGSSFKWP